MKVRIYTDGACSGNPGPGGWAVVFNTHNDCETLSGNELSTTNNRMELMAVVKACERVLSGKVRGASFELFSDSAYVVNAINGCWLDRWQLNGWKTTRGEDIKNKDLWVRFNKVRARLIQKGVKVKITKIKGHAGNAFNEYIDELAKDEVRKAQAQGGVEND